MTDKHLNLFHAYGRRHREDNLTRALIITLKALPPGLARRVLRTVLGSHHPELAKQLDPAVTAPLGVDLQVTPDSVPGTPTPETCWVVSIDTTGQATMADPSTVTGGSRPDAHIYVPETPLHLAVESKFGTNRQPSQLARHYANLTGGQGEGQVVSVTWADFTRGLEDVAPETQCSDRARYLIEEFVAYADQLNRAHLRSIPSGAFEGSSPHEALRRLVREAFADLEGAAERLLRGTNQRFRKFAIDRLSHENLWVNFHEDGLHAGVVVGAGDRKVARQVRHLFQDHPECLRSIADRLATRVTNVDSALEVRYRQQLRVWGSQLRHQKAVLSGVGGTFSHPQDLQDFRAQFCSSEMNPDARLTREEINERFSDLADARGFRRGEDGRFPRFKPPGDQDGILVHAFLTLNVLFPREWLLGADPVHVIDIFRDVLTPLVETADAIQTARVNKT